MTPLLSKEHHILEKGVMKCRPLGVDKHGRKIRDVSGITACANVEYLEEGVRRRDDPEAGARVLAALVQRLNERIPDPAYDVTMEFLKNTWNSYSYEFVAFLGEFCQILSGDPLFSFHCGDEKFIPPLIQTLERSFSVQQIYKMWPHFGDKYAKDSLGCELSPRHRGRRDPIINPTTPCMHFRS